ncbi:MAG: hypothetical protein RIQ99_546 [Pseudomonadota bacterium]|jgi:predicted NAD/FAD-dependent oxidoreductase
MKFAIVGAGMAGLSCAAGLSDIGHEVTLLDKGRGPGGRMSTRRIDTPLGEVSFDHGAQYFTARDPGFRTQVADWVQRGIVASWPVPAPDAWVGIPGMNAVIKAMASTQDVRWGVHVDRIERADGQWLVNAGDKQFDGFDAVLIAVPAEQALPFVSLHDFMMAREAMLARSQPCWTGLFTFAQPLPSDHAIIRDCGALGWAARCNAKPGRSGPEGWVVQARPEWSTTHIEADPAQVCAHLLAELADALNCAVPAPITASAHRWRYAMSAGLGLGSLWNAELGLGVCGDWLLGPRVECAWLSGQDLARRIVETGAERHSPAAAYPAETGIG